MSRRKPAAGSVPDFVPAYHAAGLDTALQWAVDAIRIGRWKPMRDLLEHTGSQWGLRTSRTQVLGSAAAGTHVVRQWLAEEPGSVDAAVMHARVSSELVLRAFRQGHPGVEDLAHQARQAAMDAHHSYLADPVPLVCMLALAAADPDQRIEAHRTLPPANEFLPPGPWRLLRGATDRDAFNREAHHRTLQVLANSRSGGQVAALSFAQWVHSRIPSGSASALLMLPLHAHAMHYRSKVDQGTPDAGFGQMHWRTDVVRTYADRALHGWFAHSVPVELSAVDLNHLAHALWADRRYHEAAAVFEVIGPHATTTPWIHVANIPGDRDSGVAEFVRARSRCLAIAGGTGKPRAGPGHRPAPR